MKLARAYKMTNRLFQGLNTMQSLWWLVIRLWIAMVFLKSGLTKIEDFDTTVLLFAEEYKVPLLPPYFAALSGTFFELACPVFLTLGLATRFAALPLLAMTAVIQFTYLDHLQHYYWAILLSGLILHGAGKWSADSWLARKYGF